MHAIRSDRPRRAPATLTARMRGAHCGGHTKNTAGAGFVSCAASEDRSVADLLLQVLPAFLPVDGALGREAGFQAVEADRSEEHTSELQSLMRISYAVFCLKKKSIKGKNALTHRQRE